MGHSQEWLLRQRQQRDRSREVFRARPQSGMQSPPQGCVHWEGTRNRRPGGGGRHESNWRSPRPNCQQPRIWKTNLCGSVDDREQLSQMTTEEGKEQHLLSVQLVKETYHRLIPQRPQELVLLQVTVRVLQLSPRAFALLVKRVDIDGESARDTEFLPLFCSEGRAFAGKSDALSVHSLCERVGKDGVAAESDFAGS